jgi:hypothetical protein
MGIGSLCINDKPPNNILSGCSRNVDLDGSRRHGLAVNKQRLDIEPERLPLGAPS